MTKCYLSERRYHDNTSSAISNSSINLMWKEPEQIRNVNTVESLLKNIEPSPVEIQLSNYSKSLNTVELLLSNISCNSVSTITVVKDTLPEYKLVIQKLPWAYEFYKSANCLTKSSELVPYYKEINKMIFEERYDDCDAFLSYTDPRYMSDVLLIGLLRLTFKQNMKLTSWSSLREQVKNELLDRGYDVNRKLRGLL